MPADFFIVVGVCLVDIVLLALVIFVAKRIKQRGGSITPEIVRDLVGRTAGGGIVIGIILTIFGFALVITVTEIEKLKELL